MNTASKARLCTQPAALDSMSRFARSLADRVGQICSDADVSATVHIPVATVELPPPIRQVVVEVVDEAVRSAIGADEGRASVVSVSLDIRPGTATLRVRDDGAALLHRDLFGSHPGRIGITGMRCRLADAGGELALHRRRPRGVEIIGRVPFGPEDGSQCP